MNDARATVPRACSMCRARVHNASYVQVTTEIMRSDGERRP